MISSRTLCFVYFALLFGTAHANSTSTTDSLATVSVNHNGSMTSKPTDTTTTSKINGKISNLTPDKAKSTTSVSTQSTPKPEERHCLLYLQFGENNLPLIVAALTVGCLTLLLISLICACQVCHLRGIISSLQPRYDNTDRHARREERESLCRDGGHPTETCLMLSEVTTAQEENREDQENKAEEENDTEQPSTEPPAKDPNGDIAQENSPEPDAEAPESSDTGV